MSQTNPIFGREGSKFIEMGFWDTELASDVDIHAKCSEISPTITVSYNGKLRTYILQKIPAGG
jgi:hypothetical protein